MAILGRIIVVCFAFCAACAVAGAVIVAAVLFPEMSDVRLGSEQDTLAVALAFGFVFVSGFALLPALIAVLVTEGFSIRSVLFYAAAGAVVGAICYLGLVDFDPRTMQFSAIDRRHLEIMSGAGVLSGLIYWLIAGRNAGAWRSSRDTPQLPH